MVSKSSSEKKAKGKGKTAKTSERSAEAENAEESKAVKSKTKRKTLIGEDLLQRYQNLSKAMSETESSGKKSKRRSTKNEELDIAEYSEDVSSKRRGKKSLRAKKEEANGISLSSSFYVYISCICFLTHAWQKRKKTAVYRFTFACPGRRRRERRPRSPMKK